MKKIFTLIAAAFVACTVANAQDLRFVNAEGTPYGNEATIYVQDFTTDETWGEDMMLLDFIHIENTSSKEVTATLTATVKEISSGQFQCCLGMTCKATNKTGGILTIADQKFAGKEKKQLARTEWTPNTGEAGECIVVLTTSDGAQLTVNMIYDPTGVNAINDDLKNATRYTLDGRRADKNTKGVKVVLVGNTAKKVINK